MDFEHMRASAKSSKTSPENEKEHTHAAIIVDDHDVTKSEIVPKIVKGSLSTSSSSSTLSDEDFFQIDTGLEFTSKHEMKNVIQYEYMTVEPILSGKLPIGTPGSPYASGDSVESDNFGMVGAKQSPSIQLMGRSDVPDPNRIPSSVFDRTKSNTPMEWSVASNESLFSIHMGKSGDLTSLYSNHLDGFPPPLSGSSPAQSVGVGSSSQQPVESEVTSAQPKKDVLKAITEEHAEKDRPSTPGHVPHSDSTPRFSDCGSVNSYRSFAFPILTVEGRNGSFKGESVQPFEKEQTQQPQPQSEEHPEADTPKPKPEQMGEGQCSECCPGDAQVI
ncbi:unnamed protein product [Musa textilis]